MTNKCLQNKSQPENKLFLPNFQSCQPDHIICIKQISLLFIWIWTTERLCAVRITIPNFFFFILRSHRSPFSWNASGREPELLTVMHRKTFCFYFGNDNLALEKLLLVFSSSTNCWRYVKRKISAIIWYQFERILQLVLLNRKKSCYGEFIRYLLVKFFSKRNVRLCSSSFFCYVGDKAMMVFSRKYTYCTYEIHWSFV